MRLKTLFSAVIFLVLAACSNNPPPPAGQKATPNAGEEPAAASDGPMANYSAFQNVDACVAAGWGQGQCDRAWGTANAMAVVDAPAYASDAECSKLWKFCGAGAEQKFSPAMVAFLIAGESKGDEPPSPQDPAFYIPVFASSKGGFGYLTGNAQGPAITEIQGSKIARAAQADVAPVQ